MGMMMAGKQITIVSWNSGIWKSTDTSKARPMMRRFFRFSLLFPRWASVEASLKESMNVKKFVASNSRQTR